MWVLVGVWTGYEVWQLSGLSATVAQSGRALADVGTALEGLGSVPVVGDAAQGFGAEIRTNSAEIVQSASAAETATRRLSVLLGLSIALVPSAPVLVAYLAPLRSRPAVSPH